MGSSALINLRRRRPTMLQPAEKYSPFSIISPSTMLRLPDHKADRAKSSLQRCEASRER